MDGVDQFGDSNNVFFDELDLMRIGLAENPHFLFELASRDFIDFFNLDDYFPWNLSAEDNVKHVGVVPDLVKLLPSQVVMKSHVFSEFLNGPFAEHLEQLDRVYEFLEFEELLVDEWRQKG